MPPPPTLAVCLTCLTLFACDKHDGITVRDEPHQMAPVAPPAGQAPAMPKAQVTAGETLWAGAVPAGGGQWVIFKTIAPSTAVAAHAAALETILETNDGTLPVGWTHEKVSDKAAQFGRLDTFRSPAPEISVAVNRAGGAIAPNINRWRGQAGLNPLPEAEAAAQVKKLKNGGWVFAVEGKPQAQDAPETHESPTHAAALTFTLPAGWVQVAPSSDMRLAQFITGSGDQTCEVAITRFPGLIGGQIGTTLDNFNRWRGQLKLPLWKELPEAPQAVGMQIAGHPGAVAQIAAQDGEPATEKVMLVAFTADTDNTYFIKLTGPAAAAETQLMPMLAFLKSLKLPFTGGPAPLPADLRLLPAIGK